MMKTNINEINKMNAKVKSNAALEIVIIFALAIIVYVLAGYYDALELIVEFSREYEDYEIDEIIVVCIFIVFALTFFSLRRWRALIISDRDLKHRNIELQKAFEEIEQLKGILPICASCKKIRDDEGYWHQIELYIRDHSEADFSHGICPDCMKKLYPDFIKNDEQL